MRLAWLALVLVGAAAGVLLALAPSTGDPADETLQTAEGGTATESTMTQLGGPVTSPWGTPAPAETATPGDTAAPSDKPQPPTGAEPPIGPLPPPAQPAPPPLTDEPVEWRRSLALGVHHAGSLRRGVQLPSGGRDFFTWDPVTKTVPNRGWRRWGTDRLVRSIIRTLGRYRAANPGAPRVGIGDLSRPRGGDFGMRFGNLGHVSHQNGLDADLYYPRKDRRERRPHRPGLVDRRLAQELVDAFVAAGATRVFVGPRLDLRGPRRVVQPLVHHDDHLHVRFG